MKNILVVEDDQVLQDAICMKLKTENIGFVRARTSDDAMKVIDGSELIDAVWLDHYLIGEQDGIEIIKHIRSIPKYKQLPVYVVSNTVSPEKVTDYIDQDAKKFYVKSDYRLDEIVKDIKKEWEN